MRPWAPLPRQFCFPVWTAFGKWILQDLRKRHARQNADESTEQTVGLYDSTALWYLYIINFQCVNEFHVICSLNTHSDESTYMQPIFSSRLIRLCIFFGSMSEQRESITWDAPADLPLAMRSAKAYAILLIPEGTCLYQNLIINFQKY